MLYFLLIITLFQLLKVMLCCGRKKESIEQEFEVTQHRSLLDAGRGSTPRSITGATGKHHKHLYSRSYPESEAVAFGGRPHLQGKDLDRTGRTANGKRQRHQRDCWVRNKFGGQHQQMLQHLHKNTQKLHPKISQQIDMGIKSIETFIDYTTVETVEINKRPGQTLGFYIREGNGIDRADGVFISRIAAGSAVEQNGLLRIGEEILAIDGLSLKGVCLDDVVILMSIPSRLVLTVRTRRSCCKNLSCPSLSLTPVSANKQAEKGLAQPKVYVSKKAHLKLADKHLSQQPHSSLGGPYSHSYQSSTQQHYEGQKFPKFHMGELAQDHGCFHCYPHGYHPGYSTKQPHFSSIQKEVYNLSGKVADNTQDLSYKQFRKSRIEGLQSDDSFMKMWMEDNKCYRRPQAESLDRRTNGAILSRKYHSHDYYSDSEAQLMRDYINPLSRPQSKDWIYKSENEQTIFKKDLYKSFQRESDEDDLAGIRELSRSLSRRRKSSRLQLEKWRHRREQLDLECRIEEQQKQLYFLQQRLQVELQKQQDAVYTKPILHQKLSYPSFSNRCEESDFYYPGGKYISLNHSLQQHHMEPRVVVMDDTLEEGCHSKKQTKLKTVKNVELVSEEKEQISLHQRRYSSDSEIFQTGNGKNSSMLTLSPSTKLLITSSLLANGGKCNSLPADIENGSNGDDPTQLKHWLRKLDRLSYDLRDFNHHNNKNKNGNKKDEKQKKKDKNINKLELGKKSMELESEKEKRKSSGITLKPDTSEHTSYTSEEYKSWLSDRRLRSKLHKERPETFTSRAGARPLSGRDRAKIALSESRQKLAHSHISVISSRRHKKQAQTPDFPEKHFTTSACQTTPTIDPEKRKALSMDQSQRASKAVQHSTKLKSKTVEALVTHESTAKFAKELENVLLEHQDYANHILHIDSGQQHYPSTKEIFEDSSEMPKFITKQFLESGTKFKKGGQCEQLRGEPLRIKVEDFIPHCANRAQKKDSIRPGIDGCKVFNKSLYSLSDINHDKSGIYGLMYVKLFCGHGLKSSRKTMLRDLYCVISFDGINKARTATKTGALNFDWDEDFEIELDDDHFVGFSIYNWDPVARQKLCFASQLIISEFLSIYGDHCKLAMKLHPAGTLYIELHYKDLSKRFARVSVFEEDAIFGVDLDEIVSRERSGSLTVASGELITSEVVQSGSRVPRIIRACIRQIELRGLDCVGIYRLCGSYDRLQKLKKDLESRGFKENLLSMDNVPDINVVANVLKTFFQELPDPLLTSDLHQLFIDAINVQIETDPDGNAGLMLSILDCLPKNRLAVFSFLMDHLKRIVQHKQFNKMNSVSIGRIFGPLLICPPISNFKQQSYYLKEYNSESVDLCKQAQVITYLLDIWPAK